MRNVFRLQFRVQSHFQYLPFLTRLFYPLGEKAAARLTQITVEAFNNAVWHAHHSHKEKWVTLDIEKDDRKIRLRVWDGGSGLAKRKFHLPARWATHGRGLRLIQAKADQVRSFKTKRGHCLEACVFL